MAGKFSFYNSLTRKIDEFVPNEPGKVSMYTCGPTVYHFAHIGNIRTYIMQDALIKALEYAGYDVAAILKAQPHMTVPGAFLTLDWLRRDPVAARKNLEHMKHVVRVMK